MGFQLLFNCWFTFLIFLSSGWAQVYIQGDIAKKSFVEDFSSLTTSGYSPYRNLGAGGGAPSEIKSSVLDDNPEDRNPMGGPAVSEANLTHAGVKGDSGDIQLGVSLAIDDQAGDYSALVAMLSGSVPTDNLSPSAQKQLIAASVTSILTSALAPEFFSDLTDNPAIERGFLELANGDEAKAHQMLEDFTTLRPVSRKFLGKLSELKEPEDITAFIPEYRESYLAIKGEEISYEDAKAELYVLIGLVNQLRFGEGWEGLCFELAAWNSIPGNQQMIQALHGQDGEIFLCNSAISLQEIEHLIPLLYDGVQIDYSKRVGTGKLLPAPNSKQFYTRNIMNGDWLSFDANASATERMKYEEMLSTFLYDEYFQRQGVHPNGVDFCQFESMMLNREEGDPLPIIDLGDSSGEIWNHTVLDYWRKVVHTNTLEERVRELSTISSIETIPPEQKENWEQVQKHLGDLCEDSTFTNELDKKSRLLCAQLRDARVGPLMVEEKNYSTYIYECPNVNAECIGSNSSECLRKTRDCSVEKEEYCLEDSLCKGPHCLKDRGAGQPLCYGSLYKKGKPFVQGKYFALAIQQKNKRFDELALELIKSLRKAPRELLASYEFQEVWNSTTVLDGGDYQSTKSSGPKTKKEKFQGSVLVKNGKPLSCRWKDVWSANDTGDPNSRMESRVPASLYSIEIPQCQMEENFAIQLLQEVGECPTLALVAKEYTKMLLELSLGNAERSAQAITTFESWARTQQVRGVDVDELVDNAKENFLVSE